MHVTAPLWGTAFLNLYRTGHPLYILASRYGMSQLIQPCSGAETAVEHYYVSQGRIVGKGACRASANGVSVVFSFFGG